MPDGPAVAERDVVYLYDGGFDGFLCCVFESYARREIPAEILSQDAELLSLYPQIFIVTDPAHAQRVAQAARRKIGGPAWDFMRRAFLTCAPHRERDLLLFVRLGFRFGPRVMQMLADDVVARLRQAVLHLENEAHLLLGFARFSDCGGALVSRIGPKNRVLPLLAPHFRARFPEEYFLIFDSTHGMALVYRPHTAAIVPLDALEVPAPGREELDYRRLWRTFYDTVEVPGRHNPKCRMGHMPKRYWEFMTEFAQDAQAPGGRPQPLPPAAGR